jgi:uncharacterized membrane protein
MQKEGSRMNKIIFVSFKNEKQALEGARAMREVRTNVLYAGAIIAQDPNGKVVVRQSAIERPAATLAGLLMGSLVGLLGPAAVAIDNGSGALLGAAIDAAKAGIATEFLQTIQKELAAGKTGIIAEIDEEWESPIDLRMAALGGTVFRQARVQVDDAFFEKEIEAQQWQLANLEREKETSARTQAKEELMLENARLQAKIEVTKRQIQEKQNQLAQRIKFVRKEGEERIAFLQELMTEAEAEAPDQLSNRLENIRTEYELRAKKLDQALQRCRETHPSLISRTA